MEGHSSIKEVSKTLVTYKDVVDTILQLSKGKFTNTLILPINLMWRII